MSDHLIAFLKARLDEDEVVANGAARKRRGPWRILGDHLRAVVYGNRGPDLAVADTPGSMIADHIARHDPARVLREVEADRHLLAEWQKAEADPAVDDQWNAGFAAGLRLAVQIRAARFSDHPDYRQEWKP